MNLITIIIQTKEFHLQPKIKSQEVNYSPPNCKS